MSSSTAPTTLLSVPHEIQVYMLTYLRAHDLSAVQQTCCFYNDPGLIYEVVTFTRDNVYKEEEETKSILAVKGMYTLENLRNLELAVVARALSSPEPKTGYFVSKSWIKTTLLWLEKVNEPPPTKKLSKKQQRQRARRLSDASPPWPDANSDLLCSHDKLQRCSAKSARARRRLMDKQAWKILRKLYPDSTQLDSVNGECLQCLMETETAKKTERDRMEQAKLERKRPLSNPHVRKFYTRTRGVPTHCLISNSDKSAAASASSCPLVAGTYYIIPRGWCHQWRRYVKTGDVSMPLPPESSALLCDAHKLALLPPHLEAFLHGETLQLLSTTKAKGVDEASNARPSFSLPVGTRPVIDDDTVNALRAAGLSEHELMSQQMLMLQMQQQQHQQQQQQQQQQQPPGYPVPSPQVDANQNEKLDRGNHVVVELVTEEEWFALRDTVCSPKQMSSFAVSVTVQKSGTFAFSTLPCRDCDATGSRFTSNAEVKYRRKRWEPKSVEQKRIPTKLEY